MKNGSYSLPLGVLVQFPEYFTKVKVKIDGHPKRMLTKKDFPVSID